MILAAVAIGCIPAARALATASWPLRSPVTAILLWQALGLCWGLAAVGALVGFGVSGHGAAIAAGALDWLSGLVRSNDPATSVSGIGAAGLLSLAAGVLLLAVLCWILVAASASVLRARQRQRELLSLLAHGDPKVPGALVVDHPAAAAYCLPGLRPEIVISAGALNLLDAHELAAVLAHERAHLRERHDLVLLPFLALLRAFRWARIATRAYRSVGLLLEMHADDRVLRQLPARELATALLRVGASAGGVPAGALAMAGTPFEFEIAARVIRLLRPQPALSGAAAALVVLLSAAVVALPAALLVLPLR
ncbi:MAG: M56 family metallopeptidase [Actinobacteria bacterium]|nr:M56 family metallopeptidase [Actinomycetota bacterium]MBO0834512.1 M56 family metallopeptidase [Actinomycetota bacterium]